MGNMDEVNILNTNEYELTNEIRITEHIHGLLEAVR